MNISTQTRISRVSIRMKTSLILKIASALISWMCFLEISEAYPRWGWVAQFCSESENGVFM